MAVSRPILLALLGAVLLGGVFFATMGARGSSEQPPPSPAAAPKAEKPTATDRPKDGRTLSAEGRPAQPKAPARSSAPTGVPSDVTRARTRGSTVVLFFFQRGSADDDATSRAVSALRGRKGVEVFSAPISRLAAYRGVIGGTGVSQAPAIVILNKRGSARVIEGFVDRESLAQEVTDSR